MVLQNPIRALLFHQLTVDFGLFLLFPLYSDNANFDFVPFGGNCDPD
jgi:hypothetical protein